MKGVAEKFRTIFGRWASPSERKAFSSWLEGNEDHKADYEQLGRAFLAREHYANRLNESWLARIETSVQGEDISTTPEVNSVDRSDNLRSL